MKIRLTLLIENNFRPTIDGLVLSLTGGKDDAIVEKIELLNDNEKIIDGLSRWKDGHYIGYVDTWDDWCKHWRKDRRKPGEIDVYGAEVD